MRFFNIHSVAKHENIHEKNFFREKISQCRKKTETRGTLWDFSTSILSQNIKKMQGDPLGKNFFSKKKSRSAEKNERGDPLVSPGMVCYSDEQEKPFWFSSLGQIVQLGVILFCRIFKNYFGQFVWIKRKKKSHFISWVSLHEAPTKK